MKKLILLLVLVGTLTSCGGTAKAKTPIHALLKADGITASITLVNETNCKMNETIAEYYPDADSLCFQSFYIIVGKDALGKEIKQYYNARMKKVKGTLSLIDYKKVTWDDVLYFKHQNSKK